MTLLAIVEATVLPHLQVSETQPDLVLLAVGAWSLQHSPGEASVWAMAGGLALDLFSAGPMGASAMGLLMACAVLNVDEGRPFRGNPLGMILAFILVTVAFHGVVLVVMQVTGYQISWLDVGWRVTLPRVVLNLFVAPFVYVLVRWLDRSSQREGMIG